MKAKRTAVAVNAKLLANPLAKLLAVLQTKNAKNLQSKILLNDYLQNSPMVS